MYEGDSFFTLSSGGRLGLVVLSVVLAICWLVLAQWIRRQSASMIIGAIASLALFWAFVWLSPQLYYTYYLAIVPDLPWQVVVKVPPGIDVLASLMLFRDQQSLAAHSAGLLGWALLFTGTIDFNQWLKWVCRRA